MVAEELLESLGLWFSRGAGVAAVVMAVGIIVLGLPPLARGPFNPAGLHPVAVLGALLAMPVTWVLGILSVSGFWLVSTCLVGLALEIIGLWLGRRGPVR